MIFTHDEPWITIFLSWVRRFGNDFHSYDFFHEWGDSAMISAKSLPIRLTHDKKKIVIHGNECITLFLTRYFMWWTHNSAKNNDRSLISPLTLRTVFSDLALLRHHSWSVTSRESGDLALGRHILRFFQSPSKCLCHRSSFWRRFVTYAIFWLIKFSRKLCIP